LFGLDLIPLFQVSFSLGVEVDLQELGILLGGCLTVKN